MPEFRPDFISFSKFRIDERALIIDADSLVFFFISLACDARKNMCLIHALRNNKQTSKITEKIK